MKIEKFNENNSNQSLKKTINDYNKIIKDYNDIIKEKYIQLSEDEYYQAEYGDDPVSLDNMDDIVLTNLYVEQGGYLFLLQEYDNNAQVTASYNISVSDEEMDSFTAKVDSKKYNI